MDKERDRVILDAIDSYIRMAPELGVCGLSFVILKSEVERIMEERDRFRQAAFAKGA